MKKLKILVVFNSLVGVIGGGSRHIVHAANYWSMYHKVSVVISKHGYKIGEKYIDDDVNVKIYSTLFDKYRRSEFNSILVYLSRLIKTCIFAFKLRGYDVIVSANYQQQNMLPALFAALFNKGINSKLAVYYHESSPFLKKKNFLIQVLSLINWNLSVFLVKHFFDLVFVVNGSTRNYFVKKGVPLSKVAMTSNAIHHRKIIQINDEKKEYECVFLGRLVQRKGVYDLIKVWKIITQRNHFARLCIIGEGEERDKLETKIKQEKLDKNILLTGTVSEEDKYKLLKKSSIFIYPSYQEGWGIVIAEAIACGLPVVAYDLPVYREVFKNYIFRVNVGDYKKMAKKIVDVLEHLEGYKGAMEEAKKFVSKFDWDEVAKQELSCIEKRI